MRRETIERSKTGYFSNISIEINEKQENISEFLQSPFSIENFKKQIQIKSDFYSPKQREILYLTVKKQLENYTKHEKLKQNIELLKEQNTFTITAGHQLNLYGGSLYLLYKIMDAVRLTEKLAETYPENHFVPVFWMATEDHDFAEINHLHLFQNTFSWESEQTGAVGRFSLNGIEEFKQNVLEKFQNSPNYAEYLNRFYSKGTLAEATTELLMDLVGEYGVIVLDADDKELKSSFIPILSKELEQPFLEKAIASTTEKLEDRGFHGQAFARPINLFYLHENSRERIIPLENGNYEIGEQEINREQLLLDLENHPERFSPNVVFRPLYQEYILPNLCYLGGGGEMAYWLQLKASFDTAEIPYPLIKVRNSIQWVDKTTVKRLEKLNTDFSDIFSPIDELKKRFVFENSEQELDFQNLDAKTEDFLSEIENTTLGIDKGLDTYAKSEMTRIQNQVENIKQKLIRQHKKLHDDSMRQIDSIYTKMFPENGLQERYESILPYLAKFGKEEFIQMIYDFTQPFETDLVLIFEE